MTPTLTVTFWSVECFRCGTPFALSKDFYENRIADKRSWYCPNGHQQHFIGKTDKEKLAQARATITHLGDQKDAAQRSADAYKGHFTRVKKKVSEPRMVSALIAIGRSLIYAATWSRSTRPNSPMPRVRKLAPGEKSRVVNKAPIPQTFTVGPYETDGFAIMVGEVDGHRCYTGDWTRKDLEDIIEMIQEALDGEFGEPYRA